MSEDNKRKIGPLSARAAFVPSTLNEEDRTVEVTFGTDAPVRMFDWDRGEFLESMSFEDGHVRWERLNNGAPVLDNHNQSNGTKGVIAVVESARSDDKKTGIAKLRFSKREDVEPIFQDVKDGILQGISFGYRVYAYQEEATEEDKLPKYRAIDWEPYEISFAPVQADAAAMVRKNEEGLSEVEIIPLPLSHKRSDNESNQEQMAEEANQEQAPEAVAPEAVATPEAVVEAPEAAEAPEAVSSEEAVTAERARITEINDLCRKHNVDGEEVSKFINEGITMDEVRKSVLNNLVSKDENAGQRNAEASVTVDGADKYRAAAEESIIMRVQPGTADANGGSEFRGMSLIDLGKDCLERSGESHRGLSKRQVAERALSTSDFPIILGNTINRSLNAAYEMQDRTFTQWASRGVAKDFRAMERDTLSGMMDSFKEVQEGGEYENTTMTEGKETYSVAKYGRIIPLTWEALVNDDLNAFSRIPMAFAAKAAAKQSDIVYAILTGNPTMNDGTALFHADHGNLGTDGDISDVTLTEMRKLMRQQTSLSGDFINVSPATLICGPDSEHLALKYMNSNFSPTTVGDQNIYQGMMNVVVDPRITNEDWFAAANPSMIDTIEFSFLEGEPELFTEQKQGFEVDGLQVKARMVFGAKALDHRGLFKNPNA